MSFRRSIQIISLTAFLVLLFIAAASSSVDHLNLNFFLRLDPALILITAISGRVVSLAFIPAIIVLALVPLMGRVFCGYICPMGTTIDGSDRLVGAPAKRPKVSYRLSSIKYYFLSFLIGASILGVSLVFISAPISLITRFYGLLVHPVIALFGHMGLHFIQPLAEHLDLDALVFAELNTPRFATQFFILVFFIIVFALSWVSPRFWCRHVCPSGALMALLSRKPLLRRQVTDDCTKCGKCVSNCPMNAIEKDSPKSTHHEECILCRKCEKICPEEAISFRSGTADREMDSMDFLPDRRRFIIAGLAGVGTAAVNLTGLHSLYGKTGPGQVLAAGLVRPPGSVEEKDFLALCVRCGECMIACPTNALQPVWAKAGFSGLFSPELLPRRGACSPYCNNCGAVCPTGAIRNLPIQDRIWAKTGTSIISKERCLAWEHKKRCMVCDEVCPFGAVKFGYEPGIPVPVPGVFEDRCSGCGHCEHHCPVQNRPAIFVIPMGALRINTGSFEEQGRRQGLQISLKHKDAGVPPDIQEGIAPGFTE